MSCVPSHAPATIGKQTSAKELLQIYSLFHNYSHIAAFFSLLRPKKYVFVIYLCSCEWLYGTYFGQFW